MPCAYLLKDGLRARIKSPIIEIVRPALLRQRTGGEGVYPIMILFLKTWLKRGPFGAALFLLGSIVLLLGPVHSGATDLPIPVAPSTQDANATEAPAVALQKISLQLVWKHQFEFAGFYAAIEKGFYRSQGLEV